MSNDPIVGIDLGTSNSVVAYAEPSGTVRVLADEAGYKLHPSVVSFHPNGGVIVGGAAKQRKVIDPRNTIFSVKRLIGRSFTSPEVQTARGRVPYQVKAGTNGSPMVVTRAGEYAVPEVSAIVLDHLRNVANTALATEVSRAVVTVPASFNDAQRSATATAGSIAGLTVMRVLNEPTAAALAYGHSRNLREIIAVYDFGGGTFDITLLRLDDNVYEVLGTAGDTFLGGDDLDERLVDRMVEAFLAEHHIDLRTNEVSMMRLRAVAEQTKIELSRRARAVVRIDEIAYGPKGKPLDLQIEIRRDDFVGLVSDLIDRTFPVCREAMQLAQLDNDKISDIILVGGTTKIPYVRDEVTKFFGKTPRTDINPEEAVAVGAALQATALDRMLSRRSTRQPISAVMQAVEDNTATVPRGEADSVFSSGTQSTVTQADEELFTEPPPRAPKRPTAEYPTRAKTNTREGERPVERGQHVDRFDERTPPAASKTLGRITKQTGSPPTPVPAPPPAALAPMPVGMPPLSSRTLPGTAPAPEPVRAARPATLPPPPPQPARARPPSVPNPRAASQPSGPPAISALGPNAATLLFEPTPPPAAPSTTARGFMSPTVSAAMTAPAMPTRAGPVVLDVTPHGLGIATVAGFCEELIRRNSRVPSEIRKLFTTSRDGQDLVHIIVCQGESRRLDENTVIGDLRLQDLPRRPRGETSIEVTFALDASGILQVRARDAQTGKEQRATLDLVGAVPQGEVEASRERLLQMRR